MGYTNGLFVYLLTYTQPTAAGSTDVVGLLEGLLNPPEELAVLYPGCSPDSQVVLDVADSGLFNVTMVGQFAGFIIHDYYTAVFE